MSYLLLIISSISSAAITYLLCQYMKLNIPFSKFLLSLCMGVLTGCIIFFSFPLIVYADTNTIIVGTSADFPPFTYIENSELIGFDIDLMSEIGKRLNKKIEIKNMPFNSLLPALQLGNIHAIAAGLSATPERAKHVLFATPYLEGDPLVIVSLSTAPAKNMEDLNNKEVIVNEGYTADLYLSKIQGPLIKRLKTAAEAFLALKSGRAFAFVTAQNTLKPFFEQYETHDFNVSVIHGTEGNSSIAIALQYPELFKQIQESLDSIKKDGFIQALKTKWGLQ